MIVGTTWRALAVGTAALALGACYDPGFAPCTITCALDGEPCPGGMECGTDGLCVDPGGVCVDTSGPVRRTVVAGAEHICAIDHNRLYCWGDNRHGQLGRTLATPDSALPLEVTPPVSGMGAWIDLAAGANHTCAVYEEAPEPDVLVCWGDDTAHQLGDFPLDAIFHTATTPPSTRWLGVGAGERHTCAIGTDGTTPRVYCWGGNDAGQVAGAAGADAVMAVAVQTPEVGGTWRMVDGGARHTCATTTEGALVCWGDNTQRQLAGSSTETTPRVVEPPGGYAIVAAGADHTCAVTVSGLVECWGDNSRGLGTASADPMLDAPTPVLDLGSTARWTALDTSASVTCGIHDGAPVCWGAGLPEAGVGTLGTGQATPLATVMGAAAATDVAASPSTACADDATGVACWGDSLRGELGDGTRTIEWVPTEVMKPAGFQWRSVQAGATHTCAIATNAAVEYQTYCWGLGDRGQVGQPIAPLIDAAPTPVARDDAGGPPRTVALGARHTCVVNEVGTDADVRCWGDDDLLQNPAPAEGAPFTMVNRADPEITADGAYTCVTSSTTHTPECWGTPAGDPGHASAVPTAVSTNAMLQQVSVTWGAASGCGLDNVNQTVWCFGTEQLGELGNGAMADPPWPTSVAPIGIMPMQQMARGGGQTRCAGADTLGIFCWGDNTHGQVTPGTPGAPALQPVQSLTAAQVSNALESITVGPTHACAIVQTGNTAVCWGGFELGQRTSLATSTAVANVMNPLTGVAQWVSISAGTEHTCAIIDGGRLVCWGRNTDGQLGTGPSARPFAAAVTLP